VTSTVPRAVAYAIIDVPSGPWTLIANTTGASTTVTVP